MRTEVEKLRHCLSKEWKLSAANIHSLHQNFSEQRWYQMTISLLIDCQSSLCWFHTNKGVFQFPINNSRKHFNTIDHDHDHGRRKPENEYLQLPAAKTRFVESKAPGGILDGTEMKISSSPVHPHCQLQVLVRILKTKWTIQWHSRRKSRKNFQEKQFGTCFDFEFEVIHLLPPWNEFDGMIGGLSMPISGWDKLNQENNRYS